LALFHRLGSFCRGISLPHYCFIVLFSQRLLKLEVDSVDVFCFIVDFLILHLKVRGNVFLGRTRTTFCGESSLLVFCLLLATGFNFHKQQLEILLETPDHVVCMMKQVLDDRAIGGGDLTMDRMRKELFEPWEKNISNRLDTCIVRKHGKDRSKKINQDTCAIQLGQRLVPKCA
jgi:hypothetical protein